MGKFINQKKIFFNCPISNEHVKNLNLPYVYENYNYDYTGDY